jgi:ankyrin repeat protein
MRTAAVVVLAGFAAALTVQGNAFDGAPAQQPLRVDFARDVQPILREHCVECHGPSQQMRGLRLDRRRDAMPNRVGANGARIVPGRSAESPVYRRLIGEAGPQMPPKGPLPQEQISTIKAWIDQGAEWPDALSGETVTPMPDPAIVAMSQALRDGNRAEFDRTLKDNPKSLDGKGEAGWTPLMYAALYGDAETVRTLLTRGANPNARNDAGGTALMYGVEDAEKTGLLLSAGADVNARSGEGRTALLIAVGRQNSTAVVKRLLDAGADASARLMDGRGALALAVPARDAALLQTLLARGAGSTPLPLGAALQHNCLPCFDVLLERAEPGDLAGALTAAVRLGDERVVRRLLDRGARPRADILQAAAVSQTASSPELIQTLIDRGADVHASTSVGSVLELAKRQGHATLVNALIRAGAKDDAPARPTATPRPADSVRAALTRSLPPLQRADVAFLERAGCVSCHNNSLTAMTTAAARAKGLHVDERIVRSQLQRTAAYLGENRERALEHSGIPGGIDTVSYILLGLAAEQYPSDAITDVWARYVKNNQSPDGRFQCQALRPPLESSDFQVTAASIRALGAYGPPSQRREYTAAVARAVAWLETATPAHTEDHAFKVLGLVWGGGADAAIQKAARELLPLQRSDGGWGQLAALPSDAYATGQALVALRESRAMAVTHPAYQRGIQFLIRTQLEDGSWYVRTRAPAIQPYFDSDFPHGPDQFISAAATNWAVMALTTVIQ